MSAQSFKLCRVGEVVVNKKTAEDHREFSRVETKVQAQVQAKGKEIVSRDTHDVSMKGLFVNCDADWAVGTECEIHLLLEGQDPPVDLSVKVTTSGSIPPVGVPVKSATGGGSTTVM